MAATGQRTAARQRDRGISLTLGQLPGAYRARRFMVSLAGIFLDVARPGLRPSANLTPRKPPLPPPSSPSTC